MNNISQINENENEYIKSITDFTKQFKVRLTLKNNFSKQKIVSINNIFLFIPALIL